MLCACKCRRGKRPKGRKRFFFYVQRGSPLSLPENVRPQQPLEDAAGGSCARSKEESRACSDLRYCKCVHTLINFLKEAGGASYIPRSKVQIATPGQEELLRLVVCEKEKEESAEHFQRTEPKTKMSPISLFFSVFTTALTKWTQKRKRCCPAQHRRRLAKLNVTRQI